MLSNTITWHGSWAPKEITAVLSLPKGITLESIIPTSENIGYLPLSFFPKEKLMLTGKEKRNSKTFR